MLAHELRYVKRKPTYWRWAPVALYDAVGHALAQHRPTSFLAYTGLGLLTKLFDAVVTEHPELGEWRSSVEEVDRLRTTWITRAVSEWPVEAKRLPRIFLECIRALRRLGMASLPDALRIEESLMTVIHI